MTSAAVHSAAAPRDVRRARARCEHHAAATHISAPETERRVVRTRHPRGFGISGVVPSRDRRGTTPGNAAHLWSRGFPAPRSRVRVRGVPPVPRVRHPRLGRAGPGPVRARERRKRKRRPRQTGRRGRRRVRPVDGAPGPERGPAARGRERVRARDVRVHRHGRRLDRRDGSRERRLERRRERRREEALDGDPRAGRGGAHRDAPRGRAASAGGSQSLDFVPVRTGGRRGDQVRPGAHAGPEVRDPSAEPRRRDLRERRRRRKNTPSPRDRIRLGQTTTPRAARRGWSTS